MFLDETESADHFFVVRHLVPNPGLHVVLSFDFNKSFTYNPHELWEDVMPGRLGPMEIFLILLIVVLIFGGKKIPEIGKGIGEGIKNFKDAMKNDKEGSNGEKK